MQFANVSSAAAMLALTALGGTSAWSDDAYDLYDYLIRQPGAYTIDRWTEEGAPGGFAEHETRWNAAFSQRQIGDDWALVTERFTAYPDGPGSNTLVPDSEYEGATPNQLFLIGKRNFLPRGDDIVLDLLEPPIPFDRNMRIGDSSSGATDVRDKDGNQLNLPWELTLVGTTSLSTPAGESNDCLVLNIQIGGWTSEQIVCRDPYLAAMRDSQDDGRVDVAETVACGLEPTGSCNPQPATAMKRECWVPTFPTMAAPPTRLDLHTGRLVSKATAAISTA